MHPIPSPLGAFAGVADPSLPSGRRLLAKAAKMAAEARPRAVGNAKSTELQTWSLGVGGLGGLGGLGGGGSHGSDYLSFLFCFCVLLGIYDM